MASDPNMSDHNFKVEQNDIQEFIPPEITNIKTEPKQSYLTELLKREKTCPKCKIHYSLEYFREHILVCSVKEKENQLEEDDNYSQISTFEENQQEQVGRTECPDSEVNNLTQEALRMSREIEAVHNYYSDLNYLHGNSQGSSNSKSPVSSEDNKSDEDSVDEFLLQDTTYSCSMCSYTTYREQMLNDHERYHKNCGMPILNCIYCNQKYIENDLYLHVIKIHPGQKLQGVNAAGVIVDLGETFKIKNVLQCSKCKYVARNKILLKAHMERHKFRESGTFIRNSSGLWQCDKCSHATRGICDLQKHRKNHQHLPMRYCPWCDYKSTSTVINLHKIKCIQKPKNEPVGGESNPPVTNNIKYSEKTENIPVEVESNPAETNNIKQDLIKCAHCPFSTDSQILLKSHMQYKHRLYKCLYCSIAVKNSFNFKKHLKLHKKFLHNTKCNSCDFEGPLPTVKSHCTNKNHKFSKFNTTMEKEKFNLEDENSSLKEDKEPKSIVKDVKIQQNEMYAHKCHNCSFSTINRRLLIFHSKTHSQKQPINKCSKCDYRSTPQSFKIHILSCHKAKELDIEHKIGQCFVCSASFSTNVEYQNHWKKHLEGFPTIKCKHCDFKSTSSVTITHQRQCEEHTRNRAEFEMNEEKAMDLENDEKNVSGQENKKKMVLVQCHLCDAKLCRNKIKNHIESHSKFPIQKCLQCNFKSTNKYIQTHVRQTGHYSRPRASFIRKLTFTQCTLCDAKVDSCHYKSHVESHSTSELKKCHQCSFKSTGKYMKTHIKETGHYSKRFQSKLDKLMDKKSSHSVNENETEGREKCGKANLAASESCSDEKSEITENAFQCFLCSFSTNLRFKLNMHVKKKHLEKKVILNCSICSWSTDNNQLLEDHLNAHYNLNKPIMQCAYCSFKGTSTQIKYHKQCTAPKLENRTKPNVKALLKCTKSKSCTFTTYLPAELKNHNHLKPIKCDYCSFSSFFQYKLDAHLLSHTKFNMPIENCSDCNFHSTPAVLSAHKNNCLKRQSLAESSDSSSKKRRMTK